MVTFTLKRTRDGPHRKRLHSTALPGALDATGAAGVLILILATACYPQTS